MIIDSYLFSSVGRAKFSLIWIYHVHWCYCCKGTEISVTRDFVIIWGVNISLPSGIHVPICSHPALIIKWNCMLSSTYGSNSAFAFFFFSSHLWWAVLKFTQTCLYVYFFIREKLNSMNLLLYMAPIAVVFLLPATLFMEENVVGITLALARKDVKIIWYLLFNSSLAYFVNLTNFLVTKHTSALTLQVFFFLKLYCCFLLHFIWT